MAAVGLLFIFFAIALQVPSTILLAEVLLALGRRANLKVRESRPPFAVLIPAHNEALTIAKTLASIQPQLGAGDVLLVVADNCSDDTARIARELGARVVERFDDRLRGKGYALDRGIRALAASPPEVVIVIDADCTPAPGALEALARKCAATQRPIQSLYLMKAPEGAGMGVRLAAFAQVIKNLVRPLGLARVGLPCPLFGAGMAFPWPIIETAPLATGHIVEDLLLGIELTRRDAPPLFFPDAAVYSEFPSGSEGVASQRRRWEHGYLAVVSTQLIPLLANAIRTRNKDQLALALDLAVPPLALLVLLCGLLGFITAGYWLVSGLSSPFVFAIAPLASVGLAVLIAWASFGRNVVPFSTLLYSPVYAFCKISLYVGYLRGRQVQWIRSKREGE